MYTDPIADMLTRIRNGVAIVASTVDVPASKFKKSLADVLVREGYLKSVEQTKVDGRSVLRIGLKYGPRRTPIINEITRISKPGRRAYTKATHLPVVRGGHVVHHPSLAEIRAHHRGAKAELMPLDLDLAPGTPRLAADPTALTPTAGA